MEFERAKDKCNSRDCILLCENRTGGTLTFRGDWIDTGKRRYAPSREIKDGDTVRYIGGTSGVLYLKSSLGVYYSIGHSCPWSGCDKCLIRESR